MNKRTLVIAITLIVLIVLVWVVVFYFPEFRGSRPAFGPLVGNIAKEIKEAEVEELDKEFPLTLPSGFSISILSDNVPAARVLIVDSNNHLYVSQTKIGQISKINLQNGRQEVFIANLKRPHGLSFDPKDQQMLYIAEEDRISRVNVDAPDQIEKIADLPQVGRHFTRSLAFGSDGKLYLSIGSTCDTCIEKDERHGTIMVMNKDGSDFRLFATGLRNAVFIRLSPFDNLWVTEMGRDFLGDDLPPDEINIIKKAGFYGWPYCYGKNIHDEQFDNSKNASRFCKNDAIASFIDIPAHSAPLGLDFVPISNWPRDYHGDLIVAYHGSWNRTIPTGYKLVRMKLDDRGNYQGVEDFIDGWLTNEGALGRPTDVLITDDGVLYISDDKAGVIYRVIYEK